jgi:hypothetical protein
MRAVAGTPRCQFAIESSRRENVAVITASPAGPADDATIGHQLRELLANILATLVGMMQQRMGCAVSAERIKQQPKPHFQLDRRLVR